MKEHPSPMRRSRTLVLTTFLALAAGACAGTSMDTDMGPRYGVNVANEMPHPMIVSLDDGASTLMLGTVGAEREERFVIDSVTGTTVTIIARDEGDTHTVRRTVVLRAGETVEVRIN